jgi:hypothetical protein
MLEPSCAQLVVALLVPAARAVLYRLGDDRRSEAFGCRERALHALDVDLQQARLLILSGQ